MNCLLIFLRCFQIEPGPPVAMMIVEKPTKSFAARFKAQMTLSDRNGRDVGQRVNQREHVFSPLCGLFRLTAAPHLIYNGSAVHRFSSTFEVCPTTWE